MKYYLIAGETSGDLHASRLMQSLKNIDSEAEFRFIGGDQMQAVGGTCVRHYRELAYMGFIPVFLHLPTILRNMRMCKHDIAQWQPDALILVDYPGFNLSIAKDVRRKRDELGVRSEELGVRSEELGVRSEELGVRSEELGVGSKEKRPRIYYYISPKIWAWKEHRIKNIKRDVDELFSILPFEVDFFEGKHHYPIHYVGNPTRDEVDEFLEKKKASNAPPSLPEGGTIAPAHKTIEAPSGAVGGASGAVGGASSTPLIAILCGSRRQEIDENLPAMLEVTDRYAADYNIVVAGAPAIDADYYAPFLRGHAATIAFGQTYDLLSRAHAALVTSGTATLETALFGVPQVVCYGTPHPHFYAWLRKKLLKVKYISLVNLIADREVVRELVADTFSTESIDRELRRILDGPDREAMLQGYREVRKRLGTANAPDNAARLITGLLCPSRHE